VEDTIGVPFEQVVQRGVFVWEEVVSGRWSVVGAEQRPEVSGAKRARRSVVSEEMAEGDRQDRIELLVNRYALPDGRATAPDAVVSGANAVLLS
jgi:hypothetical protein